MTDAEREIVIGLAALSLHGGHLLKARRAGITLAGLDRADRAERAVRLRWPRRAVESLTTQAPAATGRRCLEEAEAAGVTVVVASDAQWPASLTHLPTPPLALYVQGVLPSSDAPAVSVVGCRAATRYGLRAARNLGERLALGGVHVVSGLARGIDAAAHEGALLGASAPTFAILGGGHGRLYPPEHRSLAERIVVEGGIVSEHPPSVPPLPGHFPRRNRIIAALGDATVVVEARERSGALVTARWAADLGREVFAVPGPIDAPTSAGPLALIRDGVRVVRGGDDVLEDLGLVVEGNPGSGAPILRLDDPEQRALAQLESEPIPFDELLTDSGMAAGQLLGVLFTLESKDLAERLPGMRFRAVRNDVSS